MLNTTNLRILLSQERTADLVLILSILKLILIILLRIGILLIQLGSIPTKNIYNILVQNVVDFCITLQFYSLIGITLFCGKSSIYGLVGFGVSLNDDWINMNDVITGYSSVILASSLGTTFWSGRLHIFSTIVSAGLLSGFIIPIILHLIWQNTSWTQNKTILDHNVHYADYSGATIHVSSAIIGLIGATFLGRKVIRLAEIDESSIGSDSPSSTSLGYFLVLIGLIGFSFPRHLNEDADLAKVTLIILVNNLMAMSSAMLTIILLQLFYSKQQFNYWNIISCIQGGVAGLVTVSAGVNNYTPFMCIAIGIMAGIQFFFMFKIIFMTSIEDYCHILATHGFCGFLGILLPPILGRTKTMGYKTPWPDLGINLIWQLGCICFIIILISPIFIFVFFVMWGTGFLRNKDDASCHNPTLHLEHRLNINCLRRMFSIYEDSIFIEPGFSGRNPHDIYHVPAESKSSPSINFNTTNQVETNSKPYKSHFISMDSQI